MNITEVVAHNLQRICVEHDLSSVDLAARADMPQKTVYSMIQGNNNCRIDNLEKVAKALLVSPTALVTPNLPTNVLMSRRVPRLMEQYAKMDMQQRDLLSEFILELLEPRDA